MLFVLVAGSVAMAYGQTLPSWGETAPMDQPYAPGEDHFVPDFPESPEAVPIDGGLGLLGAAGVAYALNRLRRREEKPDQYEGTSLRS